MISGKQLRPYVFRILGLGLGLALLLAVACGAAATATPGAAAPAAPAATAVPAAVPAATTAPMPAVPTATVIVATSDWGNELFADHNVRGEGGFYQKFIHDYLTHSEGGAKVVPGIAESWSFSPDGLSWTFVVREGVKFHNGDTLTAEDVRFSLEEEFGPTSAEQAVIPTTANIAKTIEPWELSGPNSVTAKFAEPKTFFAFYVSEVNADPAGTIFSKAYRESVGRDGYNTDPSPGTTGPFTLVRHDKGSRMLLERFEEYWKMYERNHQFKTLDLRLVPEASTRVAALRAGEADLIEANLEVRDQIEAAGGQIIFGPEAVYLWMLSEGCFPGVVLPVPCDKKEFRQALDYAIDKEFIANEIYGSEMAGAKGWAHVSPSAMGYEPDLDSWPYDPDMAMQKLAEAGCAKASCFPDPYKVYTWEAGELPFVPDVAQLVCDGWEKVFGINCVVEVGDSVSIKSKMHAFELAGYYSVRPNELRFDGGSTTFSGHASSEPTRSKNPEVAAIVKRAVGVIGTEEERHNAYHEMYVATREDHAEWSLFYVNTPWGAGPKIKTWKPFALTPYATALWTIELN